MAGSNAGHRSIFPHNLRSVVPALLLLLTLCTTIIAGALYQGADLLHHPRELLLGLPFSISLLLILGTHELGHFIASKRLGVITTWPLFIPGPPIPPMIGTFGAVIRIKSPISTKNALVDIGAAGPLAGFVVALIVTAIGLRASTVIVAPHMMGAMGFGFGSPLIFHVLTYLTFGPLPADFNVFLSPVAFAGWIGFFVTAMNLLPLGQLDGGHVIYALLGRNHMPVSFMLVAVMALLGYFAWPGWFIWAALITIIGLRHPPLTDYNLPMDRRRKLTTAAAMAVFILTFMPTPFYII
ncbi:MAG: site-2 protease family protein [Thermodesulfobacteriota bacterium]